MKKNIAFFDFDGTITTHDTLLEFIKFSKGSRLFYAGFLINGLYLIAYKIKLISNQAAKEQILKHFFSKVPVEEFNLRCSEFVVKKLPGLIRPAAMEEIRKHQATGTKVVIVSASPENWIRDWTNGLGLELIASRLTVVDGMVTGAIEGKNCHGSEKVRRIRERFRLEDYEEVFAYGDTEGDKPMLSLAKYPNYKPFR